MGGYEVVRAEEELPELPEVETIVNDLQRVVGSVIEGVQVSWLGAIEGAALDEFAALLQGRRIERVGRRAKNILIYLDGGAVLLIHLRMTGRLIVSETGAPDERFQRAALRFVGGRELRFADMRKFGRLMAAQAGTLDELDARLGPEPLADEFTLDVFRQMLRSRRGSLKSALLDQRFLAGVGNIYADETLFAARIHPTVKIEELDDDAVNRLHSSLRMVLREAIGNRGTSFRDYLDGLGKPGINQDSLMVYRRTGQACRVCGASIERLAFAGRGTHFCPHCQKPSAKAS